MSEPRDIAKADTLFLCADFFGYADEIKREIEKRGRRVAWFDDRPATDSLSKALIRIAPWSMRTSAERYFDAIIAKMRAQPIRDVLVIKGEALSPDTVKRMRDAFPMARFTLYFWDSYRNMPPDSREKAALFDRVLTFDPRDAAQDNRLIYRPLFFVDRFAEFSGVPQDIDILFFGTMHGDRYAVLKRIARALPMQMHFEKVLYFRAGWLYTLNKLGAPAMWGARPGEFIFKPKTRDEIAALTARARILVDIERPIQTGFTMRTIEAMGAGRKLITTNVEVAKADFFNPANIAIIDRKEPVISDAFLVAPYVSPSSALLHRYSLKGWLEDVLPS